MRCIFSCLSDRKSRRKQITIPSKLQVKDNGAYEIIKPIKGITFEGEKTKKPITDSQEKHEDHQNGAIKERVTSDFTDENAESGRFSKEKNEEKQKMEQHRSQVHQAHSDSSMSSLFSYPINNRYKNNPSTDDESEIGDDHGFVQQESSDSLFSISVNSKKQSEPEEKEVNSPMKIREWPEKEMKMLNRNGSNRVENFTRMNVGNLGKLIMKKNHETSLPCKCEDPIFKQRLELSEAEKELKIVGSNHCANINSITKPIEKFTQKNAGKLGELTLMDEQEDKENIKFEQEISFKQRSNFSEEIKINKPNHGVETNSLLNQIENLTQRNTGGSRRFVLTDDQEEKGKIISDQEKRVPFSCQEPSFKNSSNFLETKVREVLVDTSLSSWLVVNESEKDSPKSVKNSPDRENNPLRKYDDDNSLSEKDIVPIFGTIGSFFNSIQTPQARTKRLRA